MESSAVRHYPCPVGQIPCQKHDAPGRVLGEQNLVLLELMKIVCAQKYLNSRLSNTDVIIGRLMWFRCDLAHFVHL